MSDQQMNALQRRVAELERLLLESNQSSTFEEFLQGCHQHLHLALKVETDTHLTTKGPLTAENKYYPRALKPWLDFPRAHRHYYHRVKTFFHPQDQEPRRIFNKVSTLRENGEKLSRNAIASELELETYEKQAVNDTVTDVITELQKIPQAVKDLKLGKGDVKFTPYSRDSNSLADGSAEVQARLNPQTPVRCTPLPQSSSSMSYSLNAETAQSLVRTRPDQYAIYKPADDGDNMRRLLFIAEYKPPHKLSVGNLRAGFREMGIKEEIIQKYTIPQETEERLQYNADKLVAAVATQTFHYMIENALEYSYITTGEAFVFLRVDAADPTTLYYHVAIPKEEFSDQNPDKTAVGQVVSLFLMACQSKARDQRWRESAISKLDKYAVNWEDILRNIPKTERKLAPSSIYKGRVSSVIAPSSMVTRSKRKTCDGDMHPCPNIDHDDSEEDRDVRNPPPRNDPYSTPSKRHGRKSNKTCENKSIKGAGKGTDTKQRQYCTQRCLLGITRRTPLDVKCPNFPLHPKNDKRHAVNPSIFRQLVQKALAEDLDQCAEPLGLQGARGALFRITLASHGYVFVGKGTVQAFVPDLIHEGAVYQRLEKLQGEAIPVYLGNINLVRWYYLDVGVRILHMLLMSWGGVCLHDLTMGKSPRFQRQLKLKTDRAVAEVRTAGVEQDDVENVNLLWCSEVRRVMLIDFERARYVNNGDEDKMAASDEGQKKVMQEVSRNARITDRRGTKAR